MHASYLHVHWAGHPLLAQRFADAVHSFSGSGDLDAIETVAAPPPQEPALVPASPATGLLDPLRHHGDVETGAGLLDFAVNVYSGPRPPWLDAALRSSLADIGAYPSPARAESAVAERHQRRADEVLATAGAAEVFSLVAHLRPWRLPVVVHPQFTEPHAALEQAGHMVTSVICNPARGFSLDPVAVPDDSDLVVIGNPTNPTGVLHAATDLRRLLRPGRLVVVDEAFMDSVPGEVDSLAGESTPGLLVVRSLTKHWSIPGVRAGYALGTPGLVAELRRGQVPWSVSTAAAAAIEACSTPAARAEGERRATTITGWRAALTAALDEIGLEHIASSSSFVLVRVGAGGHDALRRKGIAVRRADTFPGLDASWVRIAVRPPDQTARLLAALKCLREALFAMPSDALG